MTVAEESDAVLAGQDEDKPMSRDWQWHPDLPIPTSPVFAWPPRPVAAVKWLAGYWLALSAVVLEFALAWAVFAWLQPTAEQAQTLALDWIAQIYLRNLILLCLVAGSLHYYFYIFKGQGRRLKYDRRDLLRKSNLFTFKNQVWDNMFWSIASGVTFWTGYEVLYFWAAGNGYVPGLVFSTNPVWFIAWFVIIPMWSSMHFYWVHRALHWAPLYKLAHALHHRNINIGPWTGISMHPIEHFIYYSSVLIHFVVPSHAVHVIFHFYLNSLNPAFSHTGFDSLETGGKKRMQVGDFFHQLHHKYFQCNYGTAEMPWDRWFGSFHDGTPEAAKIMRKRMAELMKKTGK